MPLTFHPGDVAIAACITPPGMGGVAIVRLSGPSALQIAQNICSCQLENCQSHRLYRCRFSHQNPIDEGLVVVMRSPHSFTGETTVEFHLHGSPLIPHLLLRAVVDQGAQIALPGEFTYRALCHGKLDLAQAEAIANLIDAQSETALRAAHNQLTGHLSRHITALKQRLVEVAAQLEAAVDFPDEDLQTTPFGEIQAQLVEVVSALHRLGDSYRQGLVARRGLTLCLLGRPNVGKSSLLNALLQKKRAIVTTQAGTTRDVLRESLQMGGYRAHIADTAGIRSGSEDEIEIEGMRRTWDEVKSADLTLLVLEAPAGWTPEDLRLFERIDPQKTFIIWNKVDLAKMPFSEGQIPHCASHFALPSRQIPLSANSLQGFDQLHGALEKAMKQATPPHQSEVMLTSQRHWHAVNSCLKSLQRALDLTCEQSIDLIAGDVREAVVQLEQIIGGSVAEDVLSQIFSTFCLGK